jgi:tetratricopeptide (TPR) repeat protein
VNVGIAWGMSGRRAEGLAACEEGLAAVRKLTALVPANTQLRGKLGVAWIWVGNIATAIPERRERAVEAFREGTALYEGLAAAEPDNAFWRLKTGDTYIGASIALAELGRWDEALASARQAEGLYSALESADPKSDYYRQERVASQSLKAKALVGRGDLAAAEPLLVEAQRVMLEQHTSQPENVLLRERLAVVQSDLGSLHERKGARSIGPARTRELQTALDWMRKAERHYADLNAQGRLPMGGSEELEKVRVRIAQAEAALTEPS